jgi:anti-sigma regulatory factor (Ser/Thr protein kinase)
VQHRALVLRPGVEAPRVARKEVLRWLMDLGMEELSEKVLLIASELVANAAVHARTVLEVSMSTDSRSVKLGVRDDDRHFPRLDRADAPTTSEVGSWVPSVAESGRGLAIVDGLADEWGVDVLRDGKRVWARLSFPPRF